MVLLMTSVSFLLCGMNEMSKALGSYGDGGREDLLNGCVV